MTRGTFQSPRRARRAAGVRPFHPPAPASSPLAAPQVCPLPDPSLSPSAWAAQTLDFTPDPRQAELLDLPSQRLVVCTGRQQGKSFLMAAKALHLALSHPGTDYLIFGPVRAQAGELLDKIEDFTRHLQIPVKGDRNHARALVLPNRSRFVALPDVPRSVRGFSAVQAVIIDEAAFVDDRIFQAVTPMLAVSNGKLWVVSTPHGQTGRFYELCHGTHASWTRFLSPATENPRISPEFLEAEREFYGEALFNQEYMCAFIAADAQFLDRDRVNGAALPPKSLGTPVPYRTEFFIGIDVGKRQDHTAIVIIELTWSEGERSAYDLQKPQYPQITVKFAESLPLGSAHMDLPRHLKSVLANLDRSYPGFAPPKTLAIDATGESTLIEVLRRANVPAGGPFHPVAITNGYTTTNLKDSYKGIPRPDLLTRLRLTFEQRLIHLPPSTEGIEDLTRELIHFRRDGRQREHDDLVFALALGTWFAIEKRKALLGQSR